MQKSKQRNPTAGTGRVAGFLRKAVGAGLYLVLVTPLLVWDGFITPHLSAKVLGFQILVELISALVLLAIIFDENRLSGRRNLIFSPVLATTALFLAYSIFSAFMGVDWTRSLWGFRERQDGLVLLLHFFAWTLTAAWYFRPAIAQTQSPKAEPVPAPLQSGFYWYLLFSFSVSFFVALTAVGEAQGATGSFLNTIPQMILSSQRVSGVFGNPIMLGLYLLVHFFMGLHLFMAAARNPSPGSTSPQTMKKPLVCGIRLFVVVGQLLILTVIFSGQTRGVIIGLVAGALCCIFLSVYGLSTSRLGKSIAVVALLLLSLAFIGAWHYRDSAFVNRMPFLQRLLRISVQQDISTFGRTVTWSAGIQAFRDHPILGWGHNNAYYGLNKYYDPRLIRVSPTMEDTTQTWNDKTHSSLIDLAVERGAIGVVIYAILFFLIVRSLWRIPDRRLGTCFIGALVSCQIATAVAFDTFGSYFTLFLVLACLGMYEHTHSFHWLNSLSGRPPRKRAKGALISRRTSRVMKAAGVLSLLIISLYFQMEIAAAQHGSLRAQQFFLQDAAAGIYEYEYVFQRFSPYHTYEKLNCIDFVIQSITKKIKTSRSVEAGPLIQRLTREVIAEHPLDSRVYMLLNQMYNVLTMLVSPQFAKDAETFGKEAIRLSPKRQEALYTLSRTYVAMNQPVQAIDLTRRMLRDADFSLGHWGLGLALLQNNQRDEALAEIKKALNTGYQMTPEESGLLKQLVGEKEFAGLTAGK